MHFTVVREKWDGIFAEWLMRFLLDATRFETRAMEFVPAHSVISILRKKSTDGVHAVQDFAPAQISQQARRAIWI